MAPLGKVSQQQYAQVPLTEDSFEAEKGEKNPRRPEKSSLSKYTIIASLIAAALVALVAVFALGFASGYRSGGGALEAPASSPQRSSNCTEPLIRKEWRSLSKEEKKSYLDAFQCFIDSPSQLGMNGSLYDDFSWAHNLVAHSSESSPLFEQVLNRFELRIEYLDHGKAPFLTWHRRFIWVYENTLRKTCGYEGALPYEIQSFQRSLFLI
jgi:hypothetical protein